MCIWGTVGTNERAYEFQSIKRQPCDPLGVSSAAVRVHVLDGILVFATAKGWQGVENYQLTVTIHPSISITGTEVYLN